MQIGLLAPHALQARDEVVAQQALPGLAFDPAPAPVQLEAHVGVQMAVNLVEIDLDLLHAPERRRRDGDVGARARAHRVVGEVDLLIGLLALLAKGGRARAQLLDQRGARVGVDQLVHHGQALEGVLAVEDPGRVDLLRLPAVRIQRAVAEGAVDRRAADQHRVVHALGVQLGDAGRHLL